MSAPVKIGGDWVENTDESTGRKYYANTVTKESSWEYPAELKKAQAGADKPKDEWVEKLDANSGNYYYYNRTTKETTWDKPADFKPVEKPAAGVSNWASKVDPGSGQTYYYNKVTKESSWEVPAGYVEPSAKQESPKEEVKIAAASPAPAAAKKPNPPPTKSTSSTRETSKTTGAPKEDDGADDILKSVEEITQSIGEVTFDGFVEEFFKLDRKGMFNSKTSVEKISSWKNELIKTSLLQLPPDLASEALQTFRNVTGYMGDRGSSKEPLGHVTKILSSLMLAPEQLRDEVYCQICKQVNNNPDQVSTVRGWQLMVIMLSSFPPSTRLQLPLIAFCANKLKGGGDGGEFVPKYAEFAIRRIPRIFDLGPRREIPTQVELEALKRCAKVTVRINFLDKKYIMIQTDSWTTAQEFNELVAKNLGIEDASPYALFEVSSDDEERVLEPDERLLDLVSYWQRLAVEERKGKGKGAKIQEFQFVYKVRLFFDVQDSDHAGIEMMYLQASTDVVDARYPCTEQDSLTLAALQVQEKYGDHPGPGKEFTDLEGIDSKTGKPKLMNFLAHKYFADGEDRNQELIQQILKLYAKLSGYSTQEARLSYLDYVKSWKIYGSAYFFAEPQNSSLRFPSAIVLAINSKGILIVDPDTKEFLAEYTFKDVVTWGHSSNSFVVVTGGMMRQTKIYFKTDQGKEINSIVKSYVERVMGPNK
ncbi:hypothetical protein TL16_g04280 [Triparma laevis f. inornata]|uniref:Uncharacterized protein n=1 Tax=Triparma laevis f. inornata TaxID=1714386 RepID=A0A9W7E7S0_9STRA|nr:hypothetical protein TL16_g04280 [Triparma laevis f. inornata]